MEITYIFCLFVFLFLFVCLFVCLSCFFLFFSFLLFLLFVAVAIRKNDEEKTFSAAKPACAMFRRNLSCKLEVSGTRIACVITP